MGLIKRPDELQVKTSIAALIYGQPGIGKTTLALSSPNPVLFDYDGGVHRVNAAHRVPTVQIKSWEETNEVLTSEEIKEFDTIVIDTAGKMLDFMTSFILKTDPKLGTRDGALQLKGYGVRKQMFITFLKTVSMMGKNVVFVAHEREEKNGEDKQVRPEIGGSSVNDLIKELDLVGYMEAIGKKRTISFDPCEKFYGKNTCNLPSIIDIPTLLDSAGNVVKGNTFLSDVIKTYQAYQAKQTEKSGEYEAILDVIREKVESVVDATTANTVAEELKTLNHIFDSKIQAATILQKKASELGLKLNKTNKTYEAA